MLLVTATNRGFKEQLVSSWQPKMTINLDDNEARELQPPYKTDQGPTDVAYSGPILIIRNQGEKNDIYIFSVLEYFHFCFFIFP